MDVPQWKGDGGTDRRRWGWAGEDTGRGRGGDWTGEEVEPDSRARGLEGARSSQPREARSRFHKAETDYIQMSSLESRESSTDLSGESLAYGRLERRPLLVKNPNYNKLYTGNQREVSRTRSLNAQYGPTPSRARAHYGPSTPRAKSLGPFPPTQPSPMFPPRTQSVSSLYSGPTRYKQGTSLDLRPLRSSVSTQGVYFTHTGHNHFPRTDYEGEHGPVSISLQDLASLGKPAPPSRRSNRGLLDMTSVTINNSEISSDSALFILSAARQAVDCVGDTLVPGGHGKVAGIIKDRLEKELGEGGWQCVVGKRGSFGCCLSPNPDHYLNFDLAQVTVLIFRAG